MLTFQRHLQKYLVSVAHRARVTLARCIVAVLMFHPALEDFNSDDGVEAMQEDMQEDDS